MKKLAISLLLFCFIAGTPRCDCDVTTAFATGTAIQMVPSSAYDGLMTMASHQDCNFTE